MHIHHVWATFISSGVYTCLMPKHIKHKKVTFFPAVPANPNPMTFTSSQNVLFNYCFDTKL